MGTPAYTWRFGFDNRRLWVNLRQLEIFGAVMRTGSISEAARQLGVSQPAVSKALRLLEQGAGFVLFRRVRGRLFPSPEAESLRPEAERVFRDVATVDLTLRQLRDGSTGRVAVAAVSSVAYTFLTPAIARFAADRPGIRVDSVVLPTSLVADRVATRLADFGLVHQPTDNPHLSGDAVCEAEGVCILPRRHPLADRRTVTARELHKESLISYGADSALGEAVRRAFAAAGLRRDLDLVVNQPTQALDLVEAGAGVAIIDPYLLLAGPRPGIVAIPFRPAIPNRLRVVRARERPRSRAADRLEAVVREVIATRTREGPHAGLFRQLRR